MRPLVAVVKSADMTVVLFEIRGWGTKSNAVGGRRVVKGAENE